MATKAQLEAAVVAAEKQAQIANRALRAARLALKQAAATGTTSCGGPSMSRDRAMDVTEYINRGVGLSYGLWSIMADDMEPEVVSRSRRWAQRRAAGTSTE